ncbi:hypothetical protein BCR44DRAFT_86336 [Catenaria anguillulae PL171]|uniref:RNA polymerase II-associated protein 3 n=1 Tax=Catenaria anguillulae PL171 TaxID=765915 RepID=A0A1Y2HLT1_9FUNG|nr:hypothetical protein BCR44DRAFT_86336 [Catenaria anguillulae PL171]
MMSRPAPAPTPTSTARLPTVGPAPPKTLTSASSSAKNDNTSIADIQLHIRRNAEEYRQVLDDLADWESHIKAAPLPSTSSLASASASSRPLPPVRGTAPLASTTTQPNPQKPKTKTPRDYSAWDKIDVDSLLQEMENQDYAEYHANSTPLANPTPTTAAQRNPQLALIEKDTGNVYFKKQKFQKAIKHYSKAIELDPLNPVLYLNRAAAFLKLDPPIHTEALEDCTRALDLDHGKNVKALFRRAMAKKVGGDRNGAIDDLKRAQVLEPTNAEVKRELLLLDPPKPKPVTNSPDGPLPAPLPGPQVKVPKRRKLVVREFSSAPVAQEPVAAKAIGAQEEELMTAVKTTTIANQGGFSPSRRRIRSRDQTGEGEEGPMLDAPLILASCPPPESAPEVATATPSEPAPADPPASPSQPGTITSTPKPETTSVPSPPSVMPSLPVPQAAYEFSMAISHLTRHAHLPAAAGQRHAVSVANVSDTARAYLLSIPPKHLLALFSTAGVDTEAIGWIVVMLRSLPPATDQKSAALKYNYLHYLSQCARFGVARRLLAKVYVDMVAEVAGEIRSMFDKEGKREAVEKVDKVKAVWGV